MAVGGAAALLALLLGGGERELQRGLVLLASSVATASLASAALGLVMLAVISIARKHNLNPDNVATPIAAALGNQPSFLSTSDMVTLVSQRFISTTSYTQATW